MFSMVGGFFSTLGLFFSFLGDILIALFKFLLFMPMYLIYAGVMMVAQFAETTFKKLAGIDTIYLNGEAFGGASDGTGQDLVYAFITDAAVQDVFWSIVALSVVLLFIFTLIALIRSEFTIDLKGSAKGPIFSWAFKSLVNFFLVPTITIISIFATNFLTKTVYDLFTPEGTNIVTKCFQIGAYNANRARIDNDYVSDVLSGKLSSEFNADVEFSVGDANDLAYAIDKAFMDYGDANFSFEGKSMTELLELVDEARISDWAISMIFFGAPKNVKTFSLYNLSQVNAFYDLSKFDYILAVGSGIVISWTLLSVCLVFVKRVFELTILFLLAPPMIAIAPLDGGQAEKKWRGEFMKRLLATISPIFAYNVYFLMVPLFSNISLFGGTINIAAETAATSGTMLGSLLVAIASFLVIFDIFFQLICIIVGLGILKSASALLSSLLGVDDLVKAGGDAAKKAVDVGKKAALGATAIGGVAFKGAAMVAKGAAGIGKAAVNSIKNRNSRKDAKNQLKGAEEKKDKAAEDLKAQDEALSASSEDIAAKEKALASDKGYQDDLARRSELLDKKNTIGEDNLTDAEKQDLVALDTSIREKEKGLNDAKQNRKKLQTDREELQKASDDAVKDYGYRKRGISATKQAEIEALESDKNADGTKKDEEQLKADRKQASKMSRSFDGTNVFKNIASAYKSEFGEDADKTSLMAQITSKSNAAYQKVFGNIPILKKLPELTNSLSEQFGINGDTAKRRLNDGLAGMFGDGGGGDLWKIWFNKNARAALYEGVPESKSRSGKIDASISWGSKKKYEDEETEKKDKKENMELMKKFVADQKGLGDSYKQLLDELKDAKSRNDTAEVKNLQVKVASFERDTGINSAAAEKYDREGMSGADIKKFKERLDADADKAAAKETIAEAKATEQLVKDNGGVNIKAGSKMGLSDDALASLKKSIADAIMAASKQGNTALADMIGSRLGEILNGQTGADGKSSGGISQVAELLQKIIDLLE